MLPSIANSRSCGASIVRFGAPRQLAERRQFATRQHRGGGAGILRQIDATRRLLRRVPARRNSFRAICVMTTDSDALSSTWRSGVTAPCTTASPSPHAASMTMCEESRVAGSDVNMTPDLSEFTMRCTITATGISAGRPCLMR